MEASIDWVAKGVGLVRVHPEGSYGAPWTFGCVVVDKGEGVGELQLASRAPTRPEFRAIRSALILAGFSWLKWERRKTALPARLRSRRLRRKVAAG